MGVIYFRGKEQTAGTSVYDLAVAGGFKGTQEEFYQTLATIKQKANATDVYTKAETYTKTEIDNAINTHKIDVDSALSSTSENPVQNKIVTGEFNKKFTKWVGTKEEYDKLTSYDNNTLYVVTDETADTFVDLSMLKQYGQKSISTTLSASKWDSSNKTYSFETDYPTAQYNVDVSIDGDSCTDEQISAWGKAQFVGSSSANKLKATKEVPTIDIPVILIVSKK